MSKDHHCADRFKLGDLIIHREHGTTIGGKVIKPDVLTIETEITSLDEQWLLSAEACEQLDNAGCELYRRVVDDLDKYTLDDLKARADMARQLAETAREYLRLATGSLGHDDPEKLVALLDQWDALYGRAA